MDLVYSLVEGLGFKDVIIRGLSSYRYIVHFSYEENLEHIDIDFLKIGFNEVRKIEDRDLLPARRVWVECRGIPMSAWTEDNFQIIMKRWGNVLFSTNSIDSDNHYQNPKFLIETTETSTIDVTEVTHVDDKE